MSPAPSSVSLDEVWEEGYDENKLLPFIVPPLGERRRRIRDALGGVMTRNKGQKRQTIIENKRSSDTLCNLSTRSFIYRRIAGF